MISTWTPMSDILLWQSSTNDWRSRASLFQDIQRIGVA